MCPRRTDGQHKPAPKLSDVAGSLTIVEQINRVTNTTKLRSPLLSRTNNMGVSESRTFFLLQRTLELMMRCSRIITFYDRSIWDFSYFNDRVVGQNLKSTDLQDGRDRVGARLLKIAINGQAVSHIRIAVSGCSHLTR